MRSNTVTPVVLAGRTDCTTLGRIAVIAGFMGIPAEKRKRLAERLQARQQAAATACDTNTVGME